MTNSNSTRNGVFVAACATALLISGCSARAPQNLPNIGTSGGGSALYKGQDIRSGNAPANVGERYDADAEEDIASGALKAWRTAVAHHNKSAEQSDGDWKKQRVADEKSAMDQLNVLAKKHPTSSTVYLMMGQVEDEFDKHKEAVEYLRHSTSNNTVNSLSLFKLAENERESGQKQQAVEHYQQLLAQQPDFYPAKLGLAQCYVKDKPAEARSLAQQVLDAKLNDADATKQAEAILNQTKSGT